MNIVDVKALHRCQWAGNNPDYIKYHDNEWGVPTFDDKKLFEFLFIYNSELFHLLLL